MKEKNLKITTSYDKKILDEQPVSLPLGATMWQDTGFIGHKPVNLIVNIPTKKPKIKLLTYNQKEENRKKASFCILVEHTIGGVNKCLIVKECSRCRKFRFDDLVMLT